MFYVCTNLSGIGLSLIGNIDTASNKEVKKEECIQINFEHFL